jgi:opacity protein-like surface antigen
MLKKLGSCVLLVCAALVGGAGSANAQPTAPAFRTAGDAARHTVNFTFGRFTPRGEDARAEGDVLNANRTFLTFDIEDFKGGTFGFEYLIPIGNFVEAGAGISFYRKTVPSVYSDFIDSDGTEIDQELRLRTIPLAFTVRALPFGQSSPVQPYVGGGLALTKWSYTEVGEFIGDDALCATVGAPPDCIVDAEFEGDGWKSGLLFLAGLRWAAETVSVGGEFRFQRDLGNPTLSDIASGDAEPDLSDDFFGPTIDLGGWTLQGTIGLRF